MNINKRTLKNKHCLPLYVIIKKRDSNNNDLVPLQLYLSSFFPARSRHVSVLAELKTPHHGARSSIQDSDYRAAGFRLEPPETHSIQNLENDFFAVCEDLWHTLPAG